MKAVLCKQFGPPESLVIEELPSPRAGAGEVVLSMRAASPTPPAAPSTSSVSPARSCPRSRSA